MKLKIIFFVIAFISISLSFGQKSITDVYLEKGYEIIEKKPDSALHYFENLLKNNNQIDTLKIIDLCLKIAYKYEQDKKFKPKNLRRLLLENADKSMSKQKEILEETFNEWKGNREQIDNVTVMGIKI